MILLLAPAALAEPVGFYPPEHIAPRSELSAEASANLSGPFEQRAAALEQLAVALRHYREALDLLGDRVPQAERERLEAIEKSFHRQEAELQAFADALVGDFDGAMRGAMERAAASYGEAMRCQGQIAAGPRVPGMPVKTQKNPECQGRDLNADIAAARTIRPGWRSRPPSSRATRTSRRSRPRSPASSSAPPRRARRWPRRCSRSPRRGSRS